LRDYQPTHALDGWSAGVGELPMERIKLGSSFQPGHVQGVAIFTQAAGAY
jgi:hypothetical protein